MTQQSETQCEDFPVIAEQLAELGRGFYARDWVLGTSGNFSAVLQAEPLRLVITPSGVDKGALNAAQFLQIGAAGEVLTGQGKPSDETALHLAIVRARGAGAVLHTHSVWSTILSDFHSEAGGFNLAGFEMLKGLAGVKTHEHTEWLPIIENSQNMPELARAVEQSLQQHPQTHAFLLLRHGLYTWGRDLNEAKRHVEILEFLLEVTGRTKSTR